MAACRTKLDRNVSLPPRRPGLHKIFTTFPEGWPAFGLLLMRFAVAFGGFQFAADLVARSNGYAVVSWGMAALAGIVSFALLLGVMTPLASCISALVNIRSAVWTSLLFHPDVTVPYAAAAYLTVMSIALLLLGPGAVSVDARLFGRREIIIPDDPPSR